MEIITLPRKNSNLSLIFLNFEAIAMLTIIMNISVKLQTNVNEMFMYSNKRKKFSNIIEEKK